MYPDSLARVMAERGVDARGLAERVGVHPNTAKHWLRGTVPHERNVRRLCSALGCGRDELFGGAGQSRAASRMMTEEALRYVREYWTENGWAPTYREIAEAMGGTTVYVAKMTVGLLADEGLVVVGRGPRAIRVTESGWSA